MFYERTGARLITVSDDKWVSIVGLLLMHRALVCPFRRVMTRERSASRHNARRS